MIKTIRKKITVFMIFFLVLTLFCWFNPQEVSAKTSQEVTAKKQGITYDKKIRMRTYGRGFIDVNASSKFQIKNLKTDSKYIKVRESHGYINIEACKEGTYHVTYDVKLKKKIVKLKTTVYVTDDILPFKDITIGGKKLKKVTGGYWSYHTYIDDNFYYYPQFYYSPKHKGKMKITPKPGYKIKSILISDTDYHSSKWDIECYSSGIDFENDEVENGDYVELNYIASGVNESEDENLGDTIKYRDEYKYKTAYTHVSICYWDKYLKANAWMEIVVCVDAVK